MRKLSLSLLLLFFALFLTNQSYSQINLNWKWMHPKPQGNTLRYVKMFSASTWYAVGYYGYFIKTTDGGSSWIQYSNAGGIKSAYGYGATLYSGWFFNMNTGLVCGAYGWIGRTTNGGVDWDSVSSGSTASLYGMHFINSNTGFIGGTSGTIRKTTNAGVTWTTVTSGTTSSIYNIFALDANHIYAPSTSGNLRITTNGGTSWTQVATGGSTLYDVGFMNVNTGFVTGSSGHVRLTTNGGTSWTGVNPSSTSTKYEVQAIPPMGLAEDFTSTTFPPTGWLTQNVSGTNVWTRNTSSYHSSPASAFINYQSTGGEDWLKSPPITISAGDSVSFWARKYFSSSYPPDSLIIRVSPSADTTTASFTGVVFRIEVNSMSTSFGRYGASLNAYAGQTVRIAFQHKDTDGNGLYLDDVYIGPTGGPTPSQVYIVGDPFYIYKSTNLGANWTQINHLDPSQIWTSTFYSMSMSGNALVAVGASGMMNRSTNGGANWHSFNTWIQAGTFYDIWAEYNNTKVMAVGSGSNTTKGLRSTNGGATWTAMDNITTTTKYFRSISMVNSNTGYICGSSGGMFKTTNFGASWDSLPFPGTQLLYSVDFVNANTGWTSSSSSSYLWKTTNGGNTWTSQSGPTSAVYCVDMVNANTGWFSGSSGKIWKTTNGGTNWTAQTSNYSSTLYGVKMLDVNTGYICGLSGTVRKTTNGGTSWDTVHTPYTASQYACDWINADNGIVVGSSGYTIKTTNGGTSWTLEQTSGSTSYGVYMNSPDSAWACGSIQGIFKWAEAPQSIAEWKHEIPTTYFIDQNYPNPFNPSTTIKFGIPKAGNVTLKVYDITGRLVQTLFNNAPLNAGTVTYKFNGSNFASGVYFYSLIVDNNKIDTKKMVLVK